MNRRQFVAGAGSIAAAATTGCIGVLTGEDPVEFEASPSSVDEATLDETGYESEGVEEIVIEEEVEAAGETREVVVTNYQAQYEKTVDMGPLGEQRAALFTSLTTPQVEVLGREFNPIADMSTEDLADMVQSQYEGIENVERQEDGEVAIDGETTTQTKFAAEAEFNGRNVDIFLHISEAVELGEDLVVTVGGYPEQTPDEKENVLTLMEAVRPAE